jgi:hypothetical protein
MRQKRLDGAQLKRWRFAESSYLSRSVDAEIKLD